MIYSLGYWASPYITHSVSAVDGHPHPNPAVLTHNRLSSPTPGRPHPHPAVLIHTGRPLRSPSFLLTHAGLSCQLPGVLVPPTVLTSTLPSSDEPYSPPHCPGRPPIPPTVS